MSLLKSLLIAGLAVLAAVPLAPLAAQQPAAERTSTVARFSVVGARAEKLLAELKARFPPLSGARFAWDPRTEQLLVIAPTSLQAQIAATVEAVPQPVAPLPAAAPNPAPNPVRAPAAIAAPQPAHAGRSPAPPRLTLTHSLARLTWPQLADELRKLGGGRFVTGAADHDGRPSLVLAARGSATPVTLEYDAAQRQVAVSGPPAGANAWLQFVARLDAPLPAGEQATETYIALDHADPTQVRFALATLGGDLNARAAGDRTTRILPGPAKPRWGGDLATMIFQQPPAAQPPAVAQPPAGQPPVDGQPADPMQPMAPGEATGVFGNVEIQFIPGLDIYVIKGAKKDVDRVVAIINDIERLSGTTQPVVEVLPLKHVDSEAIANVVVQVYDQVLLARQGAVSITPLVKPNALLIIGRADSVQTVIDLVRKLDEPVPAATQFAVIPLKYASAADVELAITTFYQQAANQTALPPGIGLRVRVLADFRTNSLIVRAAPRDLVEVKRMVAQLDVESSQVKDEVRIFPLRNSLADELAATLNSAIAGTGRAGGGTTGQVGPGGIPIAQPGAAAGAAGQARTRSAQLVLQVIDAQGRRVLESGILNDVRISSDPRGNALVVTGPAKSMDLIAALIAQLDRLPSATAQIKVFTIVNGDATQLVTMLNTLFGLATGGQTGNQLFQPLAQTAGEDGSLVRLRFSVDQRTNSIIASGSAGDLAVVEAILLRLDESDIRQRQNTVYRLKSAPALDISNALNQFLQTQRDVRNLAPETISPFEQIEREVIVVPEPVSNSLIISATPRYFDEIMRIVDQLDARPPMVLIQVLIAEVQLDHFREIGIEMGLQDSLLFDRSVAGATLAPGFNWNNQPLGNSSSAASLATRDAVAAQGLTNFALGRSNTALGYGGLVLSAASDSVNVLMRALQDRSRTQILSRPQVMTLDNQPAFVQVGSRVPYVTGTTVTTNGTTNSTTFENVGILLGVTPRITPDGLVLMEIDAEKSELGPIDQGIPVGFNAAGDPILSPQINTTTAQTTVSGRSGQTVILSGLITKNRSVRERRIPFVSDIPILGNAFRYDSWTDQRTELLIIMTPYVVRTPEDVEFLKQMESQRMHWCLADVVDVHGNVGLSSACEPFTHGPAVIYPDENPAAENVPSPEGRPAMQPTPAYPGQPGVVPPGGLRLPPQGPTGPSILPPQPPAAQPPPGGLPSDVPDSSRRTSPQPFAPSPYVQPAASAEIPAYYQQPVYPSSNVQRAYQP